MAAPQESSRRRAGIRFGVAFQIVLACVLLGAVNYAGFHYYLRSDWSPAQKYRLGEQTIGLLGQLPAPVTVYVFFSPTTAAPGFEIYGDVMNLLKEYQFTAGDKLTVEYIDPMRNLGRARELQARFEFGPEENLVVVESGGKTKQISAVDMAEYDFIPQLSGDPPRVVAFKGEQALTSALIELGEETQRTVYFLQGQGEPRVGGGSTLSLLQEYIARQGVRVAPLNLGVTGGVPEDAAGILIVGPRYDLPPASAQLLGDYWTRDGRIMVLLDPAAETPLLREFLASAGITPLDDRVLRTVELGFVTAIVRDVVGTFSAVSRVTRRLYGAEAMLPGATCSLELNAKTEGTLVEPLITAGEPFWGEKDHVTDESKGVAFDAGADTAAPLIVAAMAERGGVADEKVDVGSARLVVVGNSEFVSDGVVTEPNLDFGLNALNWMLDRGHLTGIAPKTVRAFSLNLTDLETGRIALYTLVLIPAAAALAGIIVWWRRRH
ncbi:MAG: GldG family protein [Verrucomicrobia bacterium]|nr:GldG family protein [Verrucomicrobiota bacterium]MDA1203343.1 GldG family protein [Verrucomicrobiota bacterium]